MRIIQKNNSKLRGEEKVEKIIIEKNLLLIKGLTSDGMNALSKIFLTIIEESLKTRLTENSFSKHTSCFCQRIRYSQKLSDKNQIQIFVSFLLITKKPLTVAVSLSKPQSNNISCTILVTA